MKTWLKGGLIVLGLDILFWLIFLLSIIWKDITGTLSDIGGLAYGAIIVYGGISLIPAFIIGAIIGALSEKAFKIEKELITATSKIGFFIGLAISLFIFIAGGLDCYFNPNRFKTGLECFFGLPWILYIILMALPFICAWILWVTGSLIKREKRK